MKRIHIASIFICFLALTNLIHPSDTEQDPEEITEHTPLNPAQQKRNEDFLKACKLSHNKRAKELLKSGADINYQDGIGFTALMYAAADANTRLVKHLLLHGANAGLTNRSGFTACEHV